MYVKRSAYSNQYCLLVIAVMYKTRLSSGDDNAPVDSAARGGPPLFGPHKKNMERTVIRKIVLMGSDYSDYRQICTYNTKYTLYLSVQASKKLLFLK